MFSLHYSAEFDYRKISFVLHINNIWIIYDSQKQNKTKYVY